MLLYTPMVRMSKYSSSDSPVIAALQNKLHAISGMAFEEENAVLNAMLPQLVEVEEHYGSIRRKASALIREIRQDHSEVGIESFMNQFGLNNYEGITIMCMAEALLRIPDSYTADRLIHDKLKDAQWKQYLGENYLGNSESLFMHASLWGLVLTGKVVNLEKEGSTLSHMRNKIIGRMGEPVIRKALQKAMIALGSHFVIGKDIDSACATGRKLEQKGYSLSYDMLGEGARTAAQAEKYFISYLEAIERVAEGAEGENLWDRPSISIKLSALHPRYEWMHLEAVMRELLPKLKQLALAAKQQHISIAIDAEESTRLDLELQLFLALIADEDFEGYDGIGFVLQAYQKRALAVVEWLRDVGESLERRIPVRLVKGAYWDTEIQEAQRKGLKDYPVFTRKCHTDMSYLACAQALLAYDGFYPQFATHNATTIATIMAIGKARPEQ